MAMKKIEDIIKNNKEMFNSEEPFEGHFERFSQKLKNQSKRTFRIISIKILKVAIITLLIGLSAMWIYDNKIRPKSSTQYTLSNVSKEYAEVENYYISTINTSYNEIKSFDFYEKNQKKMLLRELQGIDSLYISLQKDLKSNPTDQRIIDAMINYYQMKVELLNQIITQLKQLNNQLNNDSYEDYEI